MQLYFGLGNASEDFITDNMKKNGGIYMRFFSRLWYIDADDIFDVHKYLIKNIIPNNVWIY